MERSCYTCRDYSICPLRKGINDLVLLYIKTRTGTLSKISELLGDQCRKYVFDKESCEKG